MITAALEYQKSAAEALRLLSETKLRPFTREDWQAFAGCESLTPMIGEFDDYTVVLDADTIMILHASDEGGGQLFKLSGDLT